MRQPAKTPIFSKTFKNLLNKKVIITKENYFIYSLFEDLYEDIKNAKIFEKETRKINNEEVFILDEDLSIDNIDDIDIPIKLMTEKEIEESNLDATIRFLKNKAIYLSR